MIKGVKSILVIDCEEYDFEGAYLILCGVKFIIIIYINKTFIEK